MTILQKAQAILTEKTSKVIPNNIRAGVTMFDVTGNVVELNGETTTATPSTFSQTITPGQGYNAITQITIDAVDNTIDANITPENIKAGVTILGVTGTYTGEDVSM